MHALVVGKFLPYHKGHQFLLEQAAALCDRLSAVICVAPNDPFTAESRVAWISGTIPTANITLVLDVPPFGFYEEWAKRLVALVGVPELLVTSERYGQRLCEAIPGCRHHMVDLERCTFPVSGSAVRTFPPAVWAFISSSVQECLSRRITVFHCDPESAEVFDMKSIIETLVSAGDSRPSVGELVSLGAVQVDTVNLPVDELLQLGQGILDARNSLPTWLLKLSVNKAIAENQLNRIARNAEREPICTTSLVTSHNVWVAPKSNYDSLSYLQDVIRVCLSAPWFST